MKSTASEPGLSECKIIPNIYSDHRLPKLKRRLFDVFLRALRAADSTYVVYATACVYREMYGKITECLKSGK